MANGSLDVARLVEEHHQVLFRHAYRLTGSVPDAEDAVQQTFLCAHRRIEQLRDVQCVRSWLFAILRNCYLKSVRRRTPVLAGSVDVNLELIPADVLEQDIDSERLQSALDALPDDYKLVVVMFYFEHLSYRQIAEQLGVPIGTVMSRLSRGKSQLRGRLLSCDESTNLVAAANTRNGSALLQQTPLRQPARARRPR